MRVLSLFSGIGGFDIGLERAGMTTVAFCEIDPFCRAVLKKHWPHVPQFEDVRTLHGDQVGPVDLICGGYPCQPFSLAGKRGGAEDDRHLWPEMRRVIAEVRPAWVIGENVAGHITLGLDEVLSDLEALDYTTRPFVIPACAVDAPHRRDRVWIVANANNSRCERKDILQQRRFGSVRSGEDVRDTTSERFPVRQSRPVGGPGAVAELERPSWWPSDAGVRRVAYGIPGRVHRIKAIGNAIVPQVAEVIGRAIMRAEG